MELKVETRLALDRHNDGVIVVVVVVLLLMVRDFTGSAIPIPQI